MACTCRDVFRRLSEYLDGDLSRVACQEFQRHLAACAQCRAFTNTLRKTIELCRKLPPRPIPPDVRRTLRATIRSQLMQDCVRSRRLGPH